MKRMPITAVALLLTAALFITACSKNEKTNSAVQAPVGSTTTVAPKAIATIPGVMIAGWYYDKDTQEDGTIAMKANFAALPGTSVLIFGTYNADAEDKGVEILKDIAVDNDKKDFIHIAFDEEEYWVRDYALAINAHPEVVSTDKDTTFLYTKPDLTNLGEKEVNNHQIVAVFNDELPNGASKMFKKIRYYVPDNKTWTVNGYLPTSVLDFDANTVLGYQCITKFTNLLLENKVNETLFDEFNENIKACGLSLEY